MAFLMLCFTSFLHLPIASPLQIHAATASGQHPEHPERHLGNTLNTVFEVINTLRLYDFTDDKNMKVTVAFNRFGPGLVQRMPRCRLGLFHVINNDYINWEMYAIGGSASPTFLSHGNRFLADKAKEVTKREAAPESEWSKWTWISEDDTMLSGAFFTSSGTRGPEVKAPSFAKPSSSVAAITASVGVLPCKEGSQC